MCWIERGSPVPAGVLMLDYLVCDLFTILTTLSCHRMMKLRVNVISLIIIRLFETEFVFVT